MSGVVGEQLKVKIVVVSGVVATSCIGVGAASKCWLWLCLVWMQLLVVSGVFTPCGSIWYEYRYWLWLLYCLVAGASGNGGVLCVCTLW